MRACARAQGSIKPALSKEEARAKAEDLMRKAKERREKEEKERGAAPRVGGPCDAVGYAMPCHFIACMHAGTVRCTNVAEGRRPSQERGHVQAGCAGISSCALLQPVQLGSLVAGRC